MPTLSERSKKEHNVEKIFGSIPAKPTHLSVAPISVRYSDDGKVEHRRMSLLLDFDGEVLSFPINLSLPTDGKCYPATIVVGDDKEYDYDRTSIAVLSFSPDDVANNNDNFKTGMAKYLSPKRRRKYAPGKIAIWAWAVIHLLEYALYIPEIDSSNISVLGCGIYAHVAEYAATDPRLICVNSSKADDFSTEFINQNYWLFSPEFVNQTIIQ